MENLKIYIAGPLYSDAEKNYNLKVSALLESLDNSTFLPQRDGFLFAELLDKGMASEEAKETIFKKDYDEIKKSDVVVIILDGRVPDEGACVEIGIAYVLGKICIGLKTDSRSLVDGQDNPLIIGTLHGKICRSLEELNTRIQEL